MLYEWVSRPAHARYSHILAMKVVLEVADGAFVPSMRDDGLGSVYNTSLVHLITTPSKFSRGCSAARNIEFGEGSQAFSLTVVGDVTQVGASTNK